MWSSLVIDGRARALDFVPPFLKTTVEMRPRRLPGSVLAVTFAGSATWRERLLLYPVRYDKESWVIETPAGATKERAIKDWREAKGIGKGYPAEFEAETTQVAEMAEEAGQSHCIQIGRLEARRLRRCRETPGVLRGE